MVPGERPPFLCPFAPEKPRMLPLVNAADAARSLGINVFTVYSLVRARKLPAVRSGPSERCYRFRPEDLERYAVENLTTRAEPVDAA